MPHGGYHGPPKKKKTQVKKQANPYLVGSPPGTTSQDLIQAGFTGVGGTPAADRLKISQANPNYVAPGAGGTIVTTGQDNISRREKLDAQGNVVDTTFTIPPKDDKPPKEDKKEQVKYYDDELGGLSERDLFLLEKKLGQKAIIRNGKIFFVDETGSTIPAFAMMDKLGVTLDKLTGFNPEKTFGDMGDTGKAALFNKISNMSGEEFQDFLNRKGNLDRIMDYAGTLSPTQNAKLMDMVKTGDVSGFAGLIKGQGGEGFDKALLKIQNPQKYWELNPPRTSGDLEEAARAGISYIPGFGPVDMPEGHSGQFQQQAGGVGDIPPPTTPTDPNIPTPDFLLKRQYMPGFTPNYLGGPEQMQIAGGYYDPVTKKFIGNPYGTASMYQFPRQVTTMAQGGIVGTNPLLFKNQGGMANDKGIKSFKKYGY